jgi:hypothetical protein
MGGDVERRRSRRTRKRLPCDLTIAGRRHAGSVVDLSAEGLFVQTDARAPRGAAVRVRLAQVAGAALELDAEVAHRLLARAGSKACEGLGLRLVGRIPTRYADLANAVRPENADAVQRYRVHVKGPERETWTFELSALSEMHAADLALASLGDEWDLVEVEPG